MKGTEIARFLRFAIAIAQSTPKERRGHRAEKRLSKGCFWRVRFSSAPLRFALRTSENLEGAEKKQTLQKDPFGEPFLCTTPSPLLWRNPNRGLQKKGRFRRQDIAIPQCFPGVMENRQRWRFRAAVSEPENLSFCWKSGSGNARSLAV